MPSRREIMIAGSMLGVGAAGGLVATLASVDRPAGFADRPPAHGEVGVLRAYGQLPGGPVLLTPRTRQRLRRPQDIAFQFTVLGSGPRQLRIELIGAYRSGVLHEQKVEAPRDQWALGYLLHLDHTFGDQLRVVVTVEAPHAPSVRTELPIQLI